MQIATRERAAAGRPRRVLIVDANRDAADSLALVLGLFGFETGVALSGPAALTAASDHPPDAVVIEPALPGEDGYEVARRLRLLIGGCAGGGSAAASGRTPLLIALTGYGRASDLKRSAAEGLHFHLVKPADPELLVTILRDWSSGSFASPAGLSPLEGVIEMNNPTKAPPDMPGVEQDGTVRIIRFTSGRPRVVEDVLAAELEGRTDGLSGCHLLLDFTCVERINSLELGTLIGLHKRVTASGGRLTLFNLSPQVFSVFAVTRLDTFLHICRKSPPAG